MFFSLVRLPFWTRPAAEATTQLVRQVRFSLFHAFGSEQFGPARELKLRPFHQAQLSWFTSPRSMVSEPAVT